MRFLRRFALCASVLVLISWVPALPAAMLTITPASQSVGVGDLFQVEIVVSGLGAGMAPSLGSYDITLAYNPAAFTFVGETYGDSVLGNQLDLLALGSLQLTTPMPGLVNFLELSFDSPSDLDSLQAHSFSLVTAQFQKIAGGSVVIPIMAYTLADSFGNPIEAEAVGAVIGTPDPIVATPEASGLALLAGGLAAAFALRRRLR